MAGVESLEGAAHTKAPSRPDGARMSWFRRPHFDRFDAGLLGALVALSLWTLGLDLWQVLVHARIWTGTEAVYQEDGMQSMMWIEGILRHGASPDLYVLGRTPADFFQPLLAVSAGVAALGVAPDLSLLLWKPVAIVAIFFVVRAYLHRTVHGLWARRAALTLALFFGWGAVIGDSWIVFWSWGYPFALIALACAIGALLAYARDRAAGRVGLLAPLLGALASWLHPWQGETLIVILIGSELVLLARRERVPVAALALTVALTALPLVYFAALVQFDAVWQREREAALSTYPVWLVVKAFVLLVLPAALAYRVRAASFIALTARVWPLAVVVIFALSEWQGSGSTHALLGATVPAGGASGGGRTHAAVERCLQTPAPPRGVASGAGGGRSRRCDDPRHDLHAQILVQSRQTAAGQRQLHRPRRERGALLPRARLPTRGSPHALLPRHGRTGSDRPPDVYRQLLLVGAELPLSQRDRRRTARRRPVAGAGDRLRAAHRRAVRARRLPLGRHRGRACADHWRGASLFVRHRVRDSLRQDAGAPPSS